MRILVTGGCGFIGSHFIDLMMKTYDDLFIVNMDLLTYAGNEDNVEYAGDNYVFVQGDINDKDLVRQLMVEHELSYIVNFAAESHVDRSIEDPSVFLRTNVMGTESLLSIAVELGIDRYVQISTDEVYGSIIEGQFYEDSPLDPSSPYSASKASADLLVAAYGRTYGLDYCITRCSNNYGGRQNGEKLIPKVISCTKEGFSIPVYGDGCNVRDWLYVEDHCRAIDLVLRKGEKANVYNVGGSVEMSNIQLIKKILASMSGDESLITFVSDRKGHDYRYSTNSDKLRALGWMPLMSFEDGLKITIEWFTRK